MRSSSTSIFSGDVLDPWRLPVSLPVPVVPTALPDPLMTSRSASKAVSLLEEPSDRPALVGVVERSQHSDAKIGLVDLRRTFQYLDAICLVVALADLIDLGDR